MAAIFSKEGQLQREERWVRIRESECNTWYKVKEEVMLGYLKKGGERVGGKRVMRFRLGNGMRANRYWENEEKKLCRLCREAV